MILNKTIKTCFGYDKIAKWIGIPSTRPFWCYDLQRIKIQYPG